MRVLHSVAIWMTASSLLMTGCAQPFFITQTDYIYHNRVDANDPGVTMQDVSLLTHLDPRTVRDPSKKIKWMLTLEEAKRLALTNNKEIRFLGYEPAEAGTLIDSQLSAFDAVIEAGLTWAYTNQQVTSLIQTAGTGDQAITQKLFGRFAGSGTNTTTGEETLGSLSSVPTSDLFSINKRNAAGGFTEFNFNVDYSNIDPVNAFVLVNPSWQSEANVRIEQPLLQGAGVEFNRAPILIARSNYEQAIRGFETRVRTLLRDVETQYWQLYFTFQELYSRDAGMKQALVTWQKEKDRYYVGVAALPDVAQAREQYESFRADRLQALAAVLTAERNLRELMGLPPDDDRQIIPADDPAVAEYTPNWPLAVSEAMSLRPELIQQRLLIRSSELELMRQKNGLLPDLTVMASYSITGLDDQLDQAIDRLTDMNFSSWVLGVRYQRAVGERAANSSVRNAQLALSRERLTLKNTEQTILTDLAEAYQNLGTFFDLIQVQKDRREAATDFLESREELYRQGQTTIDVLLQAQQAFADALRDEGSAIARYNQALASWQFEKGTILTNDNVRIVEQHCPQVKAKLVDQRTWQYNHSLALPLFKGHKVQGDLLPHGDGTGPLYSPESLRADPQNLLRDPKNITPGSPYDGNLEQQKHLKDNPAPTKTGGNDSTGIYTPPVSGGTQSEPSLPDQP